MKVLIFIGGMAVGAFLFYGLSMYGKCEGPSVDINLEQTIVTVGRLDLSAEWLKQTKVILYPLPTINNPRMTCLLLIKIPDQLKGNDIPSCRLDLCGFNAEGSTKPVFVPALSSRQTLDEEYIAILLDFRCPIVSEDFSSTSKLLLSSHARGS